MNKRVLSLTLLLACFSLVMQAEGRIVESFNSGWVFKKAPAGKELAVNAPKWESGLGRSCLATHSGKCHNLNTTVN